MEPPKTTNKTTQNYPQNTQYDQFVWCFVTDVITVDTCIAVCVMLRDYHVNKSCVEFSPSRLSCLFGNEETSH